MGILAGHQEAAEEACNDAADDGADLPRACPALPVVITCAISGAVASREQCPAIPYTPEEYAAEARRIVDEGGAMIHMHARTARRRAGTRSRTSGRSRRRSAARSTTLIINFSTGTMGVPVEQRIAYLNELRPDVGALNMGSMNYAKYSSRRKDFVFKTVFENSFDTIIALLQAMDESGIRPEHECFDSGHVATSTRCWTWACCSRRCRSRS